MNQDIDVLAKLFEYFPGIGKRQARRFVYFLLHKNKNYIQELTHAIHTIQDKTIQCKSCFRFFPGEKEELCTICKERGKKNELMIVEKDSDLENIERTEIYNGGYFVLGGYLSPGDTKTITFRHKKLFEKIEKNKNIKEIIFGLSLSAEGEHTRLRMSLLLKESFPHLRYSTLGRGLSTGTELEYSDTETLKYALHSRIFENSKKNNPDLI